MSLVTIAAREVLFEPGWKKTLITETPVKEVLRLLAVMRARKETKLTLNKIKRRLDELPETELEAWLRTGPLPAPASAAARHRARAHATRFRCRRRRRRRRRRDSCARTMAATARYVAAHSTLARLGIDAGSQRKPSCAARGPKDLQRVLGVAQLRGRATTSSSPGASSAPTPRARPRSRRAT
jgi:hypothetical protein